MRKVSPQNYSRPSLKHSQVEASPESPNLSNEKSQSKLQRKNFKQLVLPKVKLCEVGQKSVSQYKHKRNKTIESMESSHKKSIVQIENQANDAPKSFDDIMIKQDMEKFQRVSRLSIVKKRRVQPYPYMKFSYNQSNQNRKKIDILKNVKKQIEQEKRIGKMQRFCSQIIYQRKQKQKIYFKPKLWTKRQQLKQLKAKLQEFLKAKSQTHHIRKELIQ